MRTVGIGLLLAGALAQMAAVAAPLYAQGGTDVAQPMVTLVYTAPTSATWAPPGAVPSATAPSLFAFGQRAEVLQVVPGGYVVRHEMPLAQAREHAGYVSQQLGHPIPITIPDPTGGPPRVEYVGTAREDAGR